MRRARSAVRRRQLPLDHRHAPLPLRRGQYRYFSDPLPALIDDARHALYPALARQANRWAEQLRSDVRYPEQLDAFLEQCHRAGQTRPTPLILRYGPGGHNTLHQDLYGDLAFPIQAVTVLDRPGTTSAAASSCCSSSGRGRSRGPT